MRLNTNLHRLQFDSDIKMVCEALTSSVTSKRTSPFHITRQILLTHVANNCHVQFYPFIPRHFEIFMKNPITSVSVSFEFGVDMSWQNSM